MKARYSGPDSRDFWDRVHDLDGEDHAVVYALGCVLQDVERRVLKELMEAEMNKTKLQVCKHVQPAKDAPDGKPAVCEKRPGHKDKHRRGKVRW